MALPDKVIPLSQSSQYDGQKTAVYSVLTERAYRRPQVRALLMKKMREKLERAGCTGEMTFYEDGPKTIYRQDEDGWDTDEVLWENAYEFTATMRRP